jgi:drug/metabolite transporter (DMT)-like permease
MFDLSKKLWQWVAMLFLALVWGSSFILMKKGLLAFSFTQVAAIRVFFAFIVLIPVIIRHFSKLKASNVKSLTVVGYAGIFFPAFLFTLAQTHISSAVSGMLNSTTTLFTLLVGILFYRNQPLPKHYIGVFLGLLGALALITAGDFSSIFGVNAYAFFIIIATLGYGFNVNEVRYHLSKMNGIQVTTLSFLLVGPPAGIILFMSDLQTAWESPFFWQSLLAVIILSGVGSVISLFLFNNLIHHTSALFASSVTYIIPLFAIMWGVFDGETINLIQLAGILIVLLGVYLVNTTRKKLE